MPDIRTNPIYFYTPVIIIIIVVHLYQFIYIIQGGRGQWTLFKQNWYPKFYKLFYWFKNFGYLSTVVNFSTNNFNV